VKLKLKKIPKMGFLNFWSFNNPVDIYFGTNRLNELSSFVEGNRILLISTAGFTYRGVIPRIQELIKTKKTIVYDRVQSYPDFSDIDKLTENLRGQQFDAVIALGGGSVIDTAKIASILLSSHATTDFSSRAYFQQQFYPPCINKIHLIAIPTTAGTGSEVTPFATIWEKKTFSKHSISTQQLYPRAALLDPFLTLSLPQKETVASGLDALSHAFESIWNINANPITISYAVQSLSLSLKGFFDVVADGSNISARAAMMEASLLAGLAISNTKTALAHSMSYPITSHLGIPHGIACGFTLPAMLKHNSRVDNGRLKIVSKQLGFKSVDYLSNHILNIFKTISLAKYMGNPSNIKQKIITLIPQMLTSDRAKNNFKQASIDEVNDIILSSLEELGIA
jgi:alcohol dehydrogenase